jgi:Superinfection immunity protein
MLSMAYQFACPGCKVVLSLPTNTPGALVTCPRCGTEMQLPGAPPPVAMPIGAADPSHVGLKTDDLADHLQPGFLLGNARRQRSTGGVASLIIAVAITGFLLAVGYALVAVSRSGGPAVLARLQPGQSDSPTPVSIAIGIVIIGVLLLLYFLPTFVAGFRHHPNAAAIAVLNIFLGWTFAGWVAALVWAFTEVRSRKNIHYHYER